MIQDQADASHSSSMLRNTQWPATVQWLAASLPALILYILTLSPTVYVSGTGENIAAAAILGVPHPPGFPLFCLAGRVFVALLPVSPAVAVNILAALCMSLAAGGVSFLVARLTRVPMAGLVSGLLFAVAHIPWSQAVIGEVYGLSALAFALELICLTAWRGDLGVRVSGVRTRCFLLFAFIYGVGISVHPLHATFAPGYLWLIATASRRPTVHLWIAGAALGLIGLSLHAYTPIRSSVDPALDWGNPESMSTFRSYVTADQYRERMFSLSPGEVLGNVRTLAELLVGQWAWIGLLLPIAGAIFFWRRNRHLAMGVALIGAATIVYAINYDIPWEIEVYYLPLVLLLSMTAGWLVAARPRFLAPAALAVVCVACVANVGSAGRRGVDLIDRYGRDVLDALPENAILVTPSTNPTFILLYLTQVEELRPDIDVYVAGTQGLTRLGEAMGPGATPSTTAAQLALGDRALFYAVRDPLDDLPGHVLRPAGIVYAVVPTGAESAVGEFASLRVDPNSVDSGEDFRLRIVAARYLLARSAHAAALGDSLVAERDRAQVVEIAGDRPGVLGSLALQFADEGRTQLAIQTYERAIELGENALLTNRLGRLLLEDGDLDGAEGAFRDALRVDPELAIAHSNLGALLGSRGNLEGAVQELRLAIEHDPRSVKAYNNLGLALLQLDDKQGAAQAWRQSLALNPRQSRISALLERVSR